MDPLLEIFHKTSKPAKDGKPYIFFKNEVDLAFLYFSGFVDAKKYRYDHWIEAFKTSLLPGGSYAVSERQWLEKKKFHYTGPVNPPWDPMTLEERIYSEKEILNLLVKTVLPCTFFDSSYAQVYMNNLKAQGRLANGRAFLDKSAKEYILQVINQYPSPMRVLEISVHGLRRAKKGFTQAAQAQLQKSAFSTGSTAQQIYASRLADLAKKSPAPRGTALADARGGSQAPKEPPSPAASDQKPAISIKDLQKRRTPGKV